MDKISSGFPSDVLWLLSLNSVIHGGSWKQQCEVAAEQHQVVSVLCPVFIGLARRQMDWTPGPETVGNVTELNSLC